MVFAASSGRGWGGGRGGGGVVGPLTSWQIGEVSIGEGLLAAVLVADAMLVLVVLEAHLLEGYWRKSRQQHATHEKGVLWLV